MRVRIVEDEPDRNPLASGATREFDARGVCHGLGITCPF